MEKLGKKQELGEEKVNQHCKPQNRQASLKGILEIKCIIFSELFWLGQGGQPFGLQH